MNAIPLFPLPRTLVRPAAAAREELMHTRLPKYRRTEASARAVANRQLTDRSLEIISYLEHYHLLPTSLLVRLVQGNKNITRKHLQTLFHQGYLRFFTFPRLINPSENYYYIDREATLDLLVDAGWAAPEQLDYSRVRYNRDKRWYEVHHQDERQGSLLYLHHEADISRFHFMLELACRQSRGRVELIDWQQGPILWHTVTAPKVQYLPERDLWGEQSATERLPHRPDAFFGLRFHHRPTGAQDDYFLYERERKTTTDRKRIVRKFRSHFHYIVKTRQHQTDYGIKSIRAVLVETPDEAWAERLREKAAHPLVCGPKPSPLFWFVPSTTFTTAPAPIIDPDGIDLDDGSAAKPLPRFLTDPSVIFERIWKAAGERALRTLAN